METQRLDGLKSEDIAVAARLLKEGQVVAIPTETVYGLAADATNPAAVAGIFATKGRPADNPLIIHISNLPQLHEICPHVPPLALALAGEYWPGPLTMVLKKRKSIPDLVTGGLDTVGVRMPRHPVALAILAAAGKPLAAPSANLSGTPSPTHWNHVIADFDGVIAAVVDGGGCHVGLESTVVDMTETVPRILRPGAITAQMIARVCGNVTDEAATPSQQAQPRSPGLKYRHYAPSAPMILFTGPMAFTAQAILERKDKNCGVLCFEEYLPAMKQAFGAALSLGKGEDAAAHGRRLFDALRQMDKIGISRIYVQCPRPFGLGAATANRMERAACGNIIDCSGGKKIIGLTGRSGSGKGEMARRMIPPEALIVDADAIYARLLLEHGEMKGQLFACFPGIELDGQVDRRALGQLVFGDAQKRQVLNGVTHGYVKEEIERIVRNCHQRVVLLDVPLLFESGTDHFCTMTVGIIANDAASLERIMARDGISAERARFRLDAQPGEDFYRARCDVIVENNGSMEEFQKKIDAFRGKYSPASLL